MNRLVNKTAFITGGSSGLGLGIAHEFIAEGARVIITGRDRAALDKALKELGENAKGFISDTADMASIKQLQGKIAELFPKIDILVINAGIATFLPIEKVTEALFDQQFNVNVKGGYFTIQQVLPLMTEGGSVILMSSINAHIGRPDATIYGATKGALLTLARNLSYELIPRKIRVNAISPGPVGTPFHSKKGIPVQELAAHMKDLPTHVPLGRLGLVSEIAKTAVFLASEDSGFMLGSEIIADGGLASL